MASSTAEHDALFLEGVAVATEIRDNDPALLFRSLTRSCAKDPAHAAQLLMTLAAFVPIEEPLSVLQRRVDDIVDARVQKGVDAA